MRVLIIAVGRGKRNPSASLFEDYVKRLPWRTELKEIETRGRISAGERQDREGKLVLDALPGSGLIVALDRSGKSLTSEAFAVKLQDWQNRSLPVVSFLIGGADGLANSILQRSDEVLSFGAMTWPHMLARVMLAEQLYRASTILSGHPYHRGH
ncbi:MAG: 23S rRNA (pseudouridine(1915)-N(3))-methyltransferase RlmH [Alphaproteobacteria bacterium]|nr:23S rRNA (pseudouridine(1915)-N(3))-methyltransferase RlmH [Alphaproteobacteria bacterium]|tara:strand:- start:1992 stop:2453 length:462 start_codon:yes stop_codon:yes gene_type:complete